MKLHEAVQNFYPHENRANLVVDMLLAHGLRSCPVMYGDVKAAVKAGRLVVVSAKVPPQLRRSLRYQARLAHRTISQHLAFLIQRDVKRSNKRSQPKEASAPPEVLNEKAAAAS